jgi:hypothetical protein
LETGQYRRGGHRKLAHASKRELGRPELSGTTPLHTTTCF